MEQQEILKKYTKDSDGKFIITLASPITFGSETIKEFALEEPKAKHLRGLSQNPNMDEILGVIGKMAQQPDSVIDELSMKDTNTLSEFFTAFE